MGERGGDRRQETEGGKISTLHCKVALFLTFKNTPEKYNRDLRLVIRELL